MSIIGGCPCLIIPCLIIPCLIILSLFDYLSITYNFFH
jgi:hypothetical protein